MRKLPKPDGRTIPIHEIFDSVAGEGPTSGLPTVFVRVAGCTRTCTWCDTGYKETASATLAKIPSIRYSIEEIISMLTEFPMGERHLTFTGGEPLPYLIEFARAARQIQPAYGTSIETNGEPLNGHFAHETWQDITFVISPKLRSSGKKSPINFFGDRPNVFYKFVIADMYDVEDLRAWMDFDYYNDIYIQPMANSEVSVEVVMDCISNLRCRLFKPTQIRSATNLFGEPYTPEGVGYYKVPRVRVSIQMHKVLGLA